jgi:Flp pilus assembly protein TadG
MSTTRSNSATARRREGESGVILVEFAFVLPLLLLLVFGIVDFGRIMTYYIDQTDLASSGARWAAVNRYPCLTDPSIPACQASGGPASLQEYLRNSLITKEQFRDARVCVSIDKSGPAAKVGDAVTVEVILPFKFLPDVWAKVFKSSSSSSVTSFDIKGSATMRLEASPPLNYLEECAEPPST